MVVLMIVRPPGVPVANNGTPAFATIVGDMLELGDIAEECHKQLNLFDIDEVILVGALMKGLVKTNPGRDMRCFVDVPSLLSWLEQQDFPAAQSTTLLKSSHGVGLYKVADFMRNRGQHVI